MYELQTLKGFLDNPIGKGTSILPNRELILNDFKRRHKSMLDKGKKFNVEIYHNETTDAFYFHIKVPSETERNNTYDVVLQLTPPKINTGIMKPQTIEKYNVRFFSNSPSFVFTYAHIMYQNDMMVKFLAKKYNKLVLRKEPKITNPTGVILYEKSITFAILTVLSDVNYMSRAYLKTIQKQHVENVLFTKIRTDEKILEEIHDENVRLGKAKSDKEKKRKEEFTKKSNDARKLSTSMTGSSNSGNRKISARKTTSSHNKNKSTNRVAAKKSTRKN